MGNEHRGTFYVEGKRESLVLSLVHLESEWEYICMQSLVCQIESRAIVSLANPPPPFVSVTCFSGWVVLYHNEIDTQEVRELPFPLLTSLQPYHPCFDLSAEHTDPFNKEKMNAAGNRWSDPSTTFAE